MCRHTDIQIFCLYLLHLQVSDHQPTFNILKPFLRLRNSSDPQWEPLSTSYPKLLQELINDSSRRSQKNPGEHLKDRRPHDTTLGKRVGRNGIHGRAQRRKPLLTKKTTKAHLRFTKRSSGRLGKHSVDWDKSRTFRKVWNKPSFS